MRLLLVGIAVLASSATVLVAQRNGAYGASLGSGSVWRPAAHGPNVTPGLNNGSGVPFGFRGRTSAYSFGENRARHPGRWANTYLFYPIFVGGFYGPLSYGYVMGSNYPDPTPDAAVANPSAAPPVVINQNFLPGQAYPILPDYPYQGDPAVRQSGANVDPPPSNFDAAHSQPVIRDSLTAQSPDRQQAPGLNDNNQTIFYLIAFTDHNILPVFGFRAEHNAFRYVDLEHTLHQVSLDLIDRELSQRLNEERGVEFRLSKP